ncbi:hypothetical protein AMELA_G00292790 [Ameiurus melas]|uniref:Uncharacterized protein n=1 Tax=Ameiurus melas TaxID=219545 RepID=A0A7J5ZK24_AMEME|nr:hypothetical protein AMELA_G00292790 [Ameiurus melas]
MPEEWAKITERTRRCITCAGALRLIWQLFWNKQATHRARRAEERKTTFHTKSDCCFLKMVRDSAVRIEIGRAFHHWGTVNVKVLERDLTPC